jgi:hypothetical protein
MLGYLPKTCLYTTVFSAYVQLFIVYKTIHTTLSAAQKHKKNIVETRSKKGNFLYGETQKKISFCISGKKR